MKLKKYLEHIQSKESSVMTFHIDSPEKKKKVMRNYEVTEEDIAERNRHRLMIDFDETIHDYRDGWNNGEITGEPIEGAKEAIELLKQEFNIYIFTTRAAEPESDSQSKEGQIDKIREWLDKYEIPYDEITGEKLGAFAYIDDKAIRFEGNWSDIINKVRSITLG